MGKSIVFVTISLLFVLISSEKVEDVPVQIVNADGTPFAVQATFNGTANLASKLNPDGTAMWVEPVKWASKGHLKYILDEPIGSHHRQEKNIAIDASTKNPLLALPHNHEDPALRDEKRKEEHHEAVVAAHKAEVETTVHEEKKEEQKVLALANKVREDQANENAVLVSDTHESEWMKQNKERLAALSPEEREAHRQKWLAKKAKWQAMMKKTEEERKEIHQRARSPHATVDDLLAEFDLHLHDLAVIHHKIHVGTKDLPENWVAPPKSFIEEYEGEHEDMLASSSRQFLESPQEESFQIPTWA